MSDKQGVVRLADLPSPKQNLGASVVWPLPQPLLERS